MRLTRTHALYWAYKKTPPALRGHCQQVSIDDCINAHAVPVTPVFSVSEPNNTLCQLRGISRVMVVARVLARGALVQEVRVEDRSRREGYYIKWARKITEGRKER